MLFLWYFFCKVCCVLVVEMFPSLFYFFFSFCPFVLLSARTNHFIIIEILISCFFYGPKKYLWPWINTGNFSSISPLCFYFNNQRWVFATWRVWGSFKLQIWLHFHFFLLINKMGFTYLFFLAERLPCAPDRTAALRAAKTHFKIRILK